MFKKIRRGKLRRWITGMAVVIFGITVFHIARPAASAAEPSKKSYPVRGIDLSHYNKITNFDTLASKVDFIFLRATHGLKQDKSFNKTYNKCAKAGVRVGAYHYFRFDTDGKAQAANLLKTIKNKEFEFPIVIDVEQHGNPRNVPVKKINARLNDLVKEVEKKGYSIMFYTNKHGYNTYIKPHFREYPLWICSFTDPPIDANWVFWQYSHSGKLKGAKGHIDLDTFHGSRKKFNKKFPRLNRK